MRLRRGLLFAALGFLCGACTHTRVDPLVGESDHYVSPDFRSAHPPWGDFAVRRVRDLRPSIELGRTNYLNDSYFSEGIFTRSVSTTMKSLITKELVAARVFEFGDDADLTKYVIDLDIIHFSAHSDRNLLGLIPIIPSIGVDCVIEIELRLLDQDGRRFLERRYRRADDTLTATIAGVDATGAKILLELLGQVMAIVVPDCDAAIPAFWHELGLPVQ